MNATAKRAYSFCGASPPEGEHEVRQMRSIWSGGENWMINSNTGSIPENIYIIGTMNDIDRSVESIDFAMRRRFRFIEIRAKDTQNMLDLLEDDALKDEAIARMDRLNEEILKVEDLNENYQIGASYFLKLKILDFDELWTDYIRPLLKEYIHGLYGEYDIMKRFETAYGYIGLYS